MSDVAVQSDSLSSLLDVLRARWSAWLPIQSLQLWSADDLGFHPRQALGAVPDDAQRALARACCVAAVAQRQGHWLALPFPRADGSHGACLIESSAVVAGSVLERLQEDLSRAAPEIDEALAGDRLARLSGSARHVDRLRALLALAHGFEHSADLAASFATLHRQLQGLMHAEHFFVVMLDPAREWLYYPYAADPYDHNWEPLPFRAGGLEGSLSACLVAGGRILRGSSSELLAQVGHRDTIAQARFGPSASDWLGVPMRVGEEVLGALVVQSYDPAIRFDEQDPLTLSVVAEALAAAFHRRRVREALERQVQARTAELASAKDTAEAALAALREAQSRLLQAEKQAALGRLVAGLAHEMNTPLGIALTATSHLNAETGKLLASLDGGQLGRRQLSGYLQLGQESGAMIQRSLERAARLVQVFKEAAADNAVEPVRSFALGELLVEVAQTVQTRFAARGIVLSILCDDRLEVASRPGALGQVLRELLANALVHAFPDDGGGEVRMRASAEVGDSVVIEVEDTGVGMPDDIRALAFEPFTTTRRHAGQVGLGLHAGFNLVHQQLGGHLSMRSDPGRGSCFRLSLPVALSTGA